MFIVRFFDKKIYMWISLTENPVNKETAEEIYNQHTFYGKIHSDIKDNTDDLFFEIKQI